MKKIFLFTFLFVIVVAGINQQAFAGRAPSNRTAEPSPDGLWQDVNESGLAVNESQRQIIPTQYRTLTLNSNLLHQTLATSPLEFTLSVADNQTRISLPLPDGRYTQFAIFESPIMAPELAARYPDIKTFFGQGIDEPTLSVRLDWTLKGFHAMILAPGSTFFIDPYSTADTRTYISYDTADLKARAPFIEGNLPLETFGNLMPMESAVQTGDELRTYRLAMAATGEYTAFHGGTVPDALSAIVTTINRVNGIYETEVAVRMNLIANTDDIIYVDAGTDPYTNGDPGMMIDENQANIDMEIGEDNYDIGHVFGTDSGGLAGSGVCVNGNKARGVTGNSAPIGDPFDVDYVSHEIGHQFDAEHTFNGTESNCAGNRNASTAYEPGSGSTIMAYAGICGSDDLQDNSDDYFHTISFDEIVNYTTSGSGNSCANITNTGNGVPTANAGANYTIPADTPFTLTGSGSDPDGDALTYNWEEFDLGAAGPPDDSTNPPYFRSWPELTSPSRTFPRLSDLIDNTTAKGEVLPTISDDLTFRLTVRDNRAGGGGVDYDSMMVTVSDLVGPFRVLSPNTNVTWQVTGSETVTWDVAGTDGKPTDCLNVEILLSIDGGFTYPITLDANTANDGSESITVPNNPTFDARVKVACVGNIFFDISDADFTIIPLADAGGPYVTDEGIDVVLDASGSSASDLYEWDFDNDGFYDDAVGINPTFDLVGQDGVYPVGLRVTKNGVSDTDSTTVTVNNVAPTVVLDPAAPVDENTSITVSGVVSDPGWLDILTATIDWGDGSPIENVSGVLENDRPDATFTFSVSHIYGDNGVFTAEVCGYDDDTSTCETIDLQIDNVNPTATIDLTDAILINGIPTILGTAGEPVDFSGNSTDPGSDDLTLRWEWDDGSPVEETTSLVNPPLPDPFPSPSIQPRDVDVDTSHTFGDACLYQISFWAEDDDGGVSPVDTAYVIIIGTAERARHAGYWQHQYSGNGHIDFDSATLQCYLDITGFVSNVFDEARDASTIPNAHDVLFMQHNGGNVVEKLDRQLLTVWLNFANGSIGYLEMFDTGHDGVPDTTLADIMGTAEAVRLNPASTNGQLRQQTRLLIKVVNWANQNN